MFEFFISLLFIFLRGILSKPYILIISSTISASPIISGLNVGISISKILFFSLTFKS